MQILAIWNVDPITTVHVIWIAVWISGTNKCVVLHISTWTFKKKIFKIIFKRRPVTACSFFHVNDDDDDDDDDDHTLFYEGNIDY